MLTVLPINYKLNYQNNRTIAFGSKKNIAEQQKMWNSDAVNGWSECKKSGGNILQKELVTKPLLEHLKLIQPGEKVLDAGCGEGIYSRYMAKQGAIVTGIDFSEKLIHAAEKIEQSKHNNIKYLTGSITDLKDIPTQSMDKIINVMVSIYLDDKEFNKALSEFSRVLKPGGELIFLTRHPFTTKDKGVTIEKPFSSYKYMSGYFSKKPFKNVLHLKDKEMEVKFYPRTMSEIINTMLHNQLEIIELKEPKPSLKSLEKAKILVPPEYNYIPLKYYSENPMTLIIKAKKLLHK